MSDSSTAATAFASLAADDCFGLAAFLAAFFSCFSTCADQSAQ